MQMKFMKNCSLWKGLTVHGGLSPMGETTHWEQGMSVRKKEQWKPCNELTALPFPKIDNSWEEGRGSGGLGGKVIAKY